VVVMHLGDCATLLLYRCSALYLVAEVQTATSALPGTAASTRHACTSAEWHLFAGLLLTAMTGALRTQPHLEPQLGSGQCCS
jgi:hypothetical protein